MVTSRPRRFTATVSGVPSGPVTSAARKGFGSGETQNSCWRPVRSARGGPRRLPLGRPGQPGGGRRGGGAEGFPRGGRQAPGVEGGEGAGSPGCPGPRVVKSQLSERAKLGGEPSRQPGGAWGDAPPA